MTHTSVSFVFRGNAFKWQWCEGIPALQIRTLVASKFATK